MKVSWQSFKINSAYRKNPELNKEYIFFKRKLEIKYKNTPLCDMEKKLDRISKKVEKLRNENSDDFVIYFAKEIIMKGIWKKKFLNQSHIKEYRRDKINYLLNDLDKEIIADARLHRQLEKIESKRNRRKALFHQNRAEAIECFMEIKR